MEVKFNHTFDVPLIIQLGLVSCFISWIVTRSKLFVRFRESVKRIWFLGYHVSCGLCFGITISLILTSIYLGFDFKDWILTSLTSAIGFLGLVILISKSGL